ncbi:hypothetical protein JCM8547_007891 [Rhodosporidiobolus lusitaniae]
MTDVEKVDEKLQLPQHPQRAFTTPGRSSQADTSYARSLSQAELGPTVAESEEHVTGGQFVAEPVSNDGAAGGIEEGAAGGGQVRSGSVPGLGEGAALRQRRPKNARASSAPAVQTRQEDETAPAPGLVRKGTQALVQMLEPKVPIKKAPGWRSSLRNIVTYSWLNVLLVFVPVSWACHFTDQGAVVVFVMSFIAIIPLAALLGFATEDLALRIGETLGGLMNATFGNAVELIIAILALVKGELDVVQSSMIGSILSNCLLVLGMCYFAGGVRYHEQTYAVRAAQVNINMLVLAIVAFIIPVAFHAFVEDNATESLDTTDANTLKISHGVAILLLLSYLAYLAFCLWTHSYLYSPPPRPDANDPNVQAPLAPLAPSNLPGDNSPQPPEGGVFRIPSLPSLPSWGGSDDGSSDTSSSSSSESSEDSIEEHEPKLSGRVALILLVAVTVLTGVTAEWLVSSIEGIVETGGVSESFVALILLPLVGNAAEHVTAVTVATKNKLDLSMAVAVGSSVQIALFVIPILVLLGWCIDQPLSFYFDEFETTILFLSVIAVAFATSDGRTNWLEGLCLMLIYVIIAVVIFFYDPTGSSLT